MIKSTNLLTIKNNHRSFQFYPLRPVLLFPLVRRTRFKLLHASMQKRGTISINRMFSISLTKLLMKSSASYEFLVLESQEFSLSMVHKLPNFKLAFQQLLQLFHLPRK